MNKNTLLIICTIIIVLACGIYLLAPSLFDRLPSSFTITIHHDSSSSGGDRHTDEKFTFVRNTLTSGSATYHDNAGGGCTHDCTHTEQCAIADNQWVQVTPLWRGCQADFGAVPSKQSLEDAIKSGDLKSQKECRHLDTCYQVDMI